VGAGRTIDRAVLVVLAGVLVLAALFATPPGAQAACDGPPPGARTARTVTALACGLDAARVAHGVGRLHASRRLTLAAGRYAGQMATDDFFAHVSPAGATLHDRVLASGWVTDRCAWHVGEVLAWSEGPDATAAWVVRAWLDSPVHRRIVLGPDYRAVGIGVAAGAPVRLAKGVPGITVAALLGRRDCAA
jgi:uncharacterized protein YkwD